MIDEKDLSPRDFLFTEKNLHARLLFLATETCYKKMDYAFAELGFDLRRALYYFQGTFVFLTSRSLLFTEKFSHTR